MMNKSQLYVPITWRDCSNDYQDIYYHKAEGIAKITINRPQVRNAFRPQTVKEMMAAFSGLLRHMTRNLEARWRVRFVLASTQPNKSLRCT